MIAIRTYDEQIIKSILFCPEIFKTIAEDGFLKENFELDCIGDCWLLMSNDDKTIGLYHLHPRNSVTLEIHAHVLPEHRKQHSKETGLAALQWILDYAPDHYQKVIAQIPVIYENVKKFTCSFGFVEEGLNRLSYIKNGEIVDQWLLGITRTEIEGIFNEQPI